MSARSLRIANEPSVRLPPFFRCATPDDCLLSHQRWLASSARALQSNPNRQHIGDPVQRGGGDMCAGRVSVPAMRGRGSPPGFSADGHGSGNSGNVRE